jgi:hypothetical protein
MAETWLCVLPLVLAHRILVQLPVDQRARCAAVCRGWRAVLAHPSLWTRLDLSYDSGVTTGVKERVLRGAAARAGGALETLDLHHYGYCLLTSRQTLSDIVRANAGTLRELYLGAAGKCVEELSALLREAPALRVLSACTFCSLEEALALLRNEPPYNGPLRLHSLHVLARAPLARGFQLPLDRDLSPADLLALAAALPAHASLRCLTLTSARLEIGAVCDALVDASLAVQLRTLELDDCILSPASMAALARVLGGGALRALRLHCRGGVLHEPASVAVLATELRANTTLTSLDVTATGGQPVSLAALLGALTGHPSLQQLNCSGNRADDSEAATAAVTAALGALVAANAPALTELDVSRCRLGDTALGALFEALSHNTHLRNLFACQNRGTLHEEVAARLLPAVRRNASLRWLLVDGDNHSPSLAEAIALVNARRTERVARAEMVARFARIT